MKHTCPDGSIRRTTQGLQKGFKEYLDANGESQPPGAALMLSLRTRERSRHSGIRDWYAGYGRGVLVARESGIRSLIVVPPSDMLTNSVVAPFADSRSDPSRGSIALPQPRKLTSQLPPAEPNGQTLGVPAEPMRPVTVHSETR